MPTSSRPRTVVRSLAGISTAAVVLAGCGLTEGKPGVEGAIAVTATDNECQVARTEAPAGQIEFTVRNTGLVTLISQDLSEFALHARAILGLPVDTTLKSPGASAVIYGGVDAEGVVFDGVDAALQVPRTDIRLFGKPESFVKRRMGVALAYADDVDTARANAVEAAGRVTPRVP